MTVFIKQLSANDVGATGGHQGGILVPKGEVELLAFLPPLDAAIKNPDSWISCIDENGMQRKFRFVYYNNRLHDIGGTRNEYRITYMTSYFREMVAIQGDFFEIWRADGATNYSIRVRHQKTFLLDDDEPVRIKIKAGWNRAH